MPDWFYRTLSQPLLFTLPPKQSRDLALGLMGSIARLPGGKYVIDILGHMVPDARLTLHRAGLTFWTPVGFGLGLDMNATATKALARFGVGLIEVGPVGLTAQSLTALRRDPATQSLAWRGKHRLAAIDVAARLPKRRDHRVVTMARLQPDHINEIENLVDPLRNKVSAFSVALEDMACVAALVASAKGLPVFGVLNTTLPIDQTTQLVGAALAAGCAGVLVDGTLGVAGQQIFAPSVLPNVIAVTAQLRVAFGDSLTLIATGGVHQPADALELLHAGANLVQVDSGLVFSGPGLVKRIDDALMHQQLTAIKPSIETDQFESDPQREVLKQSWLWFLLLGLAMLFGSMLAAFITIGRVVLPYDEVFVGLSKADLHAVNPHLLNFLVHDRITLAGIMATVGIAYSGLAFFGARHGWHWAEGTIQVSAFTGMLSFFLFLGFGYFEPFHGFVTAVLAQFLIAGTRSQLKPPQHVPQPALREDAAWRIGLWGQLCWVLFGLGLLGAGAAISWVGISAVFVPEDLKFMSTSTELLQNASPRLIPMIAHDRATVGGMLLASGFVYLLPSLWGFRKGERWLWWTLVLAAIPAFAAVIWIHLHVGYVDVWHLAPVPLAMLLFGLGAVLSRPFLCRHSEPPTPRANS
jgi:dihydroorotate dehydrogenase